MYQTRKEVENWLIEMKIENYVINEGLTIDVNDNVNLLNKKIKKIPINFGKVNGDFNCSNNYLTSLEGCPEEINGNFDCSHNELTNLKGCPKRVNGYFSCSFNQITNLEGSPEVINSHFICYNNNLTSLLGCIEVINGDFYCSYNKLTSLEYFPQEINGSYIHINRNNIAEEEELVNFNCEIKNVNYVYSDFNKDGDKEEFLRKVKCQKIKKENELLTEISKNNNVIKLNKKL